MKNTLALLAALCPLVASAPFAPALHAQLTAVDPSYQATPYFTHTNTDHIVSYDWASNNNIYYQTSTSGFNFGGFYQRSSSKGAINQIVAGNSSFSGASVVSVGQNVYFNTSDSTQNIYKYGPVNGTPSVTLASTTPNYALATNQGRLFITGAPGFGTNHIYYSNLNSNGTLASGNQAVDLGADSGSSGPLGFDAAGDLFYAPGFGDLSIYRWSVAEVNAAIANPGANPLTATGHLWLDYSGLYASVSGGTSLLLDPRGDLLLSLTNFEGPSVLAKFGVGPNGAYNGNADTLFQDSDLIGELRMHNGGLYLSSGNQVFSIVPEPGTVSLLALGGILAAALVWRGKLRLTAHPRS